MWDNGMRPVSPSSNSTVMRSSFSSMSALPVCGRKKKRPVNFDDDASALNPGLRFCLTVLRTVDHGARVEAAVLLAPVGGDAGALGEVAHRRRLHVDDLHEGRQRTFGDTRHASERKAEETRARDRRGRWSR